MPIERIISGGQTGVDRAALDVALETGIEAGGWCPAGRRAEDGPIPPHYPVDETPSADYEQRTEWNVWDADATLIITRGPPGGGTAYTIEIAEAVGKPYLVIDLDTLSTEDDRAIETAGVRDWIERYEITALNVAGPRASKEPEIGGAAADFLRGLLRDL